MQRSGLSVLETRWAAEVLLALPEEEGLRYSLLLTAVVGVSDRMLSHRLRDLEEAGFVVREVRAGRPVSVLYSLTPRGAALIPSLRKLASA